MTNSLSYRLLGPVEVIANGRPVPIGRPRHRSVLAFLVLHANRLVSTERLVEAVWGGSEPTTARVQIQNDLSAIRRTLRGAVGCDPISTRSAGYLISCASGQVDADAFGQQVAAATRLTGVDPVGGAARLRDALSLWQGQALADVNASYADAFRCGLEEVRLRAWEQLFTIELGVGRHAETLAELTRLVNDHPLNEQIAGQLMLALYRSGRQTEALQVARRLRDTLAEQHGLDPGAALRNLEHAILRGDTSLELPSAAPTASSAAGGVGRVGALVRQSHPAQGQTGPPGARALPASVALGRGPTTEQTPAESRPSERRSVQRSSCPTSPASSGVWTTGASSTS
jgi:DNA-binding SARP family transcriptional activator